MNHRHRIALKIDHRWGLLPTLPHKKGRVTTVFKLVTPKASPCPLPPRKKGGKKKLESLLSFQDHLVGEKGPPLFFNIVPKHSQSREPLQGLFLALPPWNPYIPDCRTIWNRTIWHRTIWHLTWVTRCSKGRWGGQTHVDFFCKFVKAYWLKIDIKRLPKGKLTADLHLILSIFATADVDAPFNQSTVLWNVNRRHSFGPLVASSGGQ